jgi:outer membrane protein TolC
MKKTIIASFILLLAIKTAGIAQNLSLDEAIQRGLNQRNELKGKQVELRLAQGADAKVKAAWRPQVNVNGDFRVNTQLQKSVIPIGQFGNPGVPEDATSTVAFGVPFQNSLGLDITQKVIDPKRNIDRKTNATQVQVRENDLAQQQLNIQYEVTEAYFAALYQGEKLTLAQQAVDRAQANVDYYQVRLKDGTSLKNDLDRQLLDLSNAQLKLKKARQDLELALAKLSYEMGEAQSQAPLQLSDKLGSLLQKTETQLSDQSANRQELKAEMLQKELNELNVQQQLGKLKPTLSAYGNYSLLALNENVSAFNYVGLRLAIPIYDGKAAKLEADEYRLRQQVNQYNIETLKADFAYETRLTEKQMQQARLDLVETQKNIDLARQILETDQFRLKQGAVVPNDVKASEYSLQTAEDNYLSAVYNFLKANLEYRRASGNLGSK